MKVGLGVHALPNRARVNDYPDIFIQYNKEFFTCYLNLLLSETWLTESKDPTQILDNYNFHSSHRSGGRVGAGVGICTHKSLSAKTVHHHSTKRYSTVLVNIQHKGKSTIYGCIYHPKSRASNDTDEILRHISETMVKLTTK